MVAVAGDTGVVPQAYQWAASAGWRMPDFGKYWFGGEAALEWVGNGRRETGSSVSIGGAVQDSGGSGAGETDIGYS